MKKKIIFLSIILSVASCHMSSFAFSTNSQPSAQEMITEKLDAFSNNYQAVNYTASGLSVIEKIFNGKDAVQSGKIVRQVGYNLFSAPKASASNAGAKFDNNYKLSIGEKVSIYLYGDSVDVMAISGSNLLSPVITSQVDSKGNIFVQGLGVVPAEDKTINEVETEINKIASQKYNSLKIKLNVAGGQDFSVFVYGQVNKPGKVYINNNSSLMDVLGAAGGVKKTGTLRNISYTSGKKTKDVDLYETIFSGEDQDIIVRPNDKIFVGGIGNVVALKNGVAVPGIYETKENEQLQKLVTYAGGLLPGTQTSEVVVTSLDNNSLERTAINLVWSQAKNAKLNSGDTIEFKELYNTAENIVTIQGNIKHPATYAYKDGMKLSDILKSKKELLEETFTTQAVIRRISDKDNSVVTIPVYLEEFFAGTVDPQLKPKDIISIYKNTNSQFVDVYGCINNPKQLTYTPNMKLSSVLTDIQFIETAETSNEYNVSDIKSSTTLNASAQRVSRAISAENVAVEIISANGNIQLYYLYDIMVNDNAIRNITLNPQDKVFFRPLRGNEIIKNVKVSGFVNKPTSFKFIDGKRLTDMIEMAGGLTKDADLRGIVYTRKNISGRQARLAQKNNERDIKLLEGRIASGFKQSQTDVESKTSLIQMLKGDNPQLAKQYSGQIALNIKSNDLTKIKDIDNIFVQDGDEIYIPRINNNVSVIGEVYNEQSFVYKKGSTAGKYIKEVGGYTPNANKYRLYKVGVNGRAEKITLRSAIEAGDIIVVPRKIAGNDWLGPICDSLKGIASIIATSFVITRW